MAPGFVPRNWTLGHQGENPAMPTLGHQGENPTMPGYVYPNRTSVDYNYGYNGENPTVPDFIPSNNTQMDQPQDWVLLSNSTLKS